MSCVILYLYIVIYSTADGQNNDPVMTFVCLLFSLGVARHMIHTVCLMWFTVFEKKPTSFKAHLIILKAFAQLEYSEYTPQQFPTGTNKVLPLSFFVLETR